MSSDNFSRRRALTYVACAVIAALAIPAGAFATVAGSNMFITDPGTGHRAHVNSSGQVLVNNTGSTVKVSGNVAAVSGGTPFMQWCYSYGTGSENAVSCTLSPAIPAGKTFVVQQVSAFAKVYSNDAVTETEVYGSAPGTTDTPNLFFPMTFTGVSGLYNTYEAMLPTNFYLSSGADSTYMQNNAADGSESWRVTLTGYLR
jgi:hypothetical protein